MPKNPIEKEDETMEHDEKHEASEPELVPELSVEDRLNQEIVDGKDRLLRLAAEFENFKKIALREQQNGVKFANEALIANLLPVMDNLEQAILAAKKTSDENTNNVVIGVEMVVKQLADVLKKAGVEVFSALGLPFDPARHEAMGEQIDENADEGSVVVEYQKGYLLHQRLLRPARVIVAKRSGN